VRKDCFTYLSPTMWISKKKTSIKFQT